MYNVDCYMRPVYYLIELLRSVKRTLDGDTPVNGEAELPWDTRLTSSPFLEETVVCISYA